MLGWDVMAGESLLFIFVLVGVAFVTLLERSVLGYIQLRKGPNKVSVSGIIQPIADAVKLISKDVFVSNEGMGSYFYYLVSPAFGLTLFWALWGFYPLLAGGWDFLMGLMYFFCVSSMGVYILFGCGWFSNSFYSLLGAMRGVAQMISYEVALIFIVLGCVILGFSYDAEVLSKHQMFVWNGVLLLPLMLIWVISCLAETNRTPFDFAEGESELVSGFNVEYGGVGFALIFMAEYGVIMLMCSMVSLLFLGGVALSGVIGGFVVGLWLWIRGAAPRFRYDSLMTLAWCSCLPAAMNYFILGFGFAAISL